MFNAPQTFNLKQHPFVTSTVPVWRSSLRWLLNLQFIDCVVTCILLLLITLIWRFYADFSLTNIFMNACYLLYMQSSIKYKKGSHTDSVLGLAWNKEFRFVQCSYCSFACYHLHAPVLVTVLNPFLLPPNPIKPGIFLLVQVLINKLRYGMWLQENVISPWSIIQIRQGFTLAPTIYH